MAAAPHTLFVKSLAHELGFSFCGIARAGFLEAEAPKLEAWLHQGFHGHMRYMENHFDKRLDPTLLVPGARSVISFVYNYFPEHEIDPASGLKIAKYAYGEDYHRVVKDKLHQFLFRLREEVGAVEGRAFVDSAPVMERQWAAKAGLGWLGKNSLLLNKNMGSFFFLAELILDLELLPDGPVADHCGTCTACIDACPTKAIVAPGVINSNHCISYLTIELKDAVPESFHGQTDNWIFGCDTCQDVCPWNRFSKPHAEPRFNPNGAWPQFSREDWLELTEEVFKQNFGQAPLTRAGLEKIKLNVQAT